MRQSLSIVLFLVGACDLTSAMEVPLPRATLEQARSYDRAGQEAACMDAIARAKQLAR